MPIKITILSSAEMALDGHFKKQADMAADPRPNFDGKKKENGG